MADVYKIAQENAWDITKCFVMKDVSEESYLFVSPTGVIYYYIDGEWQV